MVLDPGIEAALATPYLVSKVFRECPRHRRWDMMNAMLQQVSQLGEHKPAPLARCASELIDQPSLSRVQHANIEIASEFLAIE